jgi:hypothetical protein
LFDVARYKANEFMEMFLLVLETRTVAVLEFDSALLAVVTVSKYPPVATPISLAPQDLLSHPAPQPTTMAKFTIMLNQDATK